VLGGDQELYVSERGETICRDIVGHNSECSAEQYIKGLIQKKTKLPGITSFLQSGTASAVLICDMQYKEK